jgi:hypothetical protein
MLFFYFLFCGLFHQTEEGDEMIILPDYNPACFTTTSRFDYAQRMGSSCDIAVGG